MENREKWKISPLRKHIRPLSKKQAIIGNGGQYRGKVEENRKSNGIHGTDPKQFQMLHTTHLNLVLEAVLWPSIIKHGFLELNEKLKPIEQWSQSY